MKTCIFLLILISISIDPFLKDINIPKQKLIASYKWPDVQPFKISSEQFSKFFKMISNDDSLSRNWRLNFLSYSRLPKDYLKILNRYETRISDHRTYRFIIINFLNGSRFSFHINRNTGILIDSGFLRHLPIYENESVSFIDDSTSMQIMRNYMELYDYKFGDLNLYCIDNYFFSNKTRIFHVYDCYTLPRSPNIYIMDNNVGTIQEKSLESLRHLCNTEFSPFLSEDSRKKIIEIFIKLYCENSIIIHSINDIPGYYKNKLDPDLEKTIRPIFKIQNNAKNDSYVYVIYTFEEIGGYIRRYRFEFNKKNLISDVQCIEIGREIGEFYYLY